MGEIIQLSAPTCVNPKCELNVKEGGEPHYGQS